MSTIRCMAVRCDHPSAHPPRTKQVPIYHQSSRSHTLFGHKRTRTQCSPSRSSFPSSSASRLSPTSRVCWPIVVPRTSLNFDPPRSWLKLHDPPLCRSLPICLPTTGFPAQSYASGYTSSTLAQTSAIGLRCVATFLQARRHNPLTTPISAPIGNHAHARSTVSSLQVLGWGLRCRARIHAARMRADKAGRA